MNIEKCDINVLATTLAPPNLWKKSWDCVKFWERSYHYSRLKHIYINIQKIIIMLRVKNQGAGKFHHHSLFNWSVIWVWNRIWSINFNITIIKGTVIESTHDSLNHRTGIGKRGAGFEFNWWRLYVPISWCLRWFITIECIELVNIFPKTGWKEVTITNDARVSLISNYSTVFANIFLSYIKGYNEFLERHCIIVGGRRCIKRTTDPTWRSQVSWGYNSL